MSIVAIGWSAQATAQAPTRARPVQIDHFPVTEGRSIEVAASDSDEVTVTVEGGKYPLVAHSTADAAQRWAARTDSLARSGRGAAGSKQTERASERNEFGHFSDILRYQHFDNSGAHRDVVAIDIGPLNVAVFQSDVSSATLDRLNAAMRRAASAARLLKPRSVAQSLATSPLRSSSVRKGDDSPGPSLSPSKQCIVQSGLPPMAYTGPNGYAAGTNLDKLVQPSLRAGSPLPSYPASAAGARVSGRVVARFVIDTAGRPVVQTFRLVGVSNPLFVESVCQALPAMRFVPSRVSGRLVPQVVEETFVIAPGPASR